MVKQMVYLSVCITLFLCSCSYCILSYVYKTLKMHAHWCIYKLMIYIYLMTYFFYISENKEMLIFLYIILIFRVYTCVYPALHSLYSIKTITPMESPHKGSEPKCVCVCVFV